MSVVCTRNPLRFDGIVKTTALNAATLTHPAKTTQTYSGGILSPAAIFNNMARTVGRRYFKDYLAQNTPPRTLFGAFTRCVRATPENFIYSKNTKKKLTINLLTALIYLKASGLEEVGEEGGGRNGKNSKYEGQIYKRKNYKLQIPSLYTW